MGLLVRMTVITMAGVVLIVGLLSDVRYAYQINMFRGIKFTFIIPLLIVILYYFKEQLANEGVRSLKSILKKGVRILHQPVRYSHVLILGVIAVAGLLYIMRTGNQPALPVSGLELKVRAWLENVFVYRPRFKEFAVGHPFMLLTLYYILKNEKKYILPLLVIGSIGQLTIINTFSHIHTPLVVSLVRVLLSLVLGILVGYVLIWVYNKLTHWVERFGVVNE